tara:strand:- start:37 stop:546 length:510 start_codon:yes stop_codon:yes gene_type:complete
MPVKLLIETVTVGAGGAASIEFTAIPQDGSDLVLLLNGRTLRTGTYGYVDDLNLNINSDGFGVNLSEILLHNVPNVKSVANELSPAFTGAVTTSNTFGNSSLYISNYTSGLAKSMSFDGSLENNSSSAGLALGSFRYNTTSAITSIKVGTGNSNFDAGSSFSLYKIKYD